MPAVDPYLPGHGDPRYAVEHYDLLLDYKVATNRLDAEAVLRVRVLETTDTLRLDLSGLHVDRVKVDGGKPKKYAHKGRVLEIKLAEKLKQGRTCVVGVRYAGKPAPVPGLYGPAGWEELTDGVLVASQPYGAPSLFPCNDRADDKATYRIQVSAEAGYLSIATGVLESQVSRGGVVTRTFVMDAPTSSYLVALHLGRLRIAELTDRVDVAHPVARPLREDDTVLRLPAMLDALEAWYGPYPFARFGAVVVDDVLEIPLEAQASATFGRNHLAPTWDNERLVVHELAHQWFGNAVTGARLRDIWLHEGFACYTEWLWSEHRGLMGADERARRHRAAIRMGGQATPLDDPGAPHMFDDWVYKRGALTLHALRGRIGDEAFFRTLRSWVSTHAGGAATSEQFVEHASREAGQDLTGFFEGWLSRVALPKD